MPAHDRWLYELLKPFELNDRVAAVMGSQIPRAWCFPLLKYEINAVFDGFGPGFGTTLFYDDDFIASEGVRNAVTFYSDVNSAARRDVLTGPVPYQDVSYAEDQLFGRDIIAAGTDQGVRAAGVGRALQRHDAGRVRRPHGEPRRWGSARWASTSPSPRCRSWAG